MIPKKFDISRMRYKIQHITEYRYEQAGALSINEGWMSPRSLAWQTVKDVRVTVKPSAASLRRREDFFGNQVFFFNVQQPHKTLKIKVESEVDRKTPEYALYKGRGQEPWEEARLQLQTFKAEWVDIKSFALPSPLARPSKELLEYAAVSFSPGRPLFEAVQDLSTRIYHDFEYKPGFTTIATPLHKVMAARKGVCQDFAHAAIGCLRSMGLPARYVSGYIETTPPEGEAKLQGSAASHAWFAAFIPEWGWVDFDPTNNQIAGDQHITVAWGRDYSDVPPLKGIVFNGSRHKLHVAVDVVRLEEDA